MTSWWRSLSRPRRYLLAAAVLLLIAAMVLGALIGVALGAASTARSAADELEVKLKDLTPLELTQPNTYLSLSNDFHRFENRMTTAHARLGLLRGLSWVPGIGWRIDEALALAELGTRSAQFGRRLSDVFQRVWTLPLQSMTPEESVEAITISLKDATPVLDQAQADVERVNVLRADLRNSSRGQRYGALLDRYLPLAQAVLHLSRTSPDTIGQFYILQRELTVLQRWTDDPISVIENPEEVDQSLNILEKEAASLTKGLDRALQVGSTAPGRGLSEETRNAIRLLRQQVALLHRVSSGVDALIKITQAASSEGFLSERFGPVAGKELNRASEELALAQRELRSLQSLLQSQKSLAESLRGSTLGGGLGNVALTPDRIESSLNQVEDFTRFLRFFLGYEGQRVYLLIGQNQNEIRATGGFIGVVAQATIRNGVMMDLAYHDSNTVDPQPYSRNPPAPDGVYWYLWMERLLFRDANWNPHFPASAAQLAEIYQAGTGAKVDGVIVGTKGLMLDLVELMGGITVPEVEGPIDVKTAQAYMEGDLLYRCTARHVSTRDKRCFDEDLFFALWDQLQSTQIGHLQSKLGTLLRQHLKRKDILIELFDPTASVFLWERGWNGAVLPVDHDYLMVVDSALPGHSSKNVDRIWDYQVTLEPNRPVEAQLRLRYQNTSSPVAEVCRQAETSPTGCFWDYFRVYIPKTASRIVMPQVPIHEGSEKLIWGYPDADSASVVRDAELGSTVLTELGGYLTVEPGTTMTIPIQYQLPVTILRSPAPNSYDYRLLVQKQPGADHDRLKVWARLPAGAELLQASPPPTARQGQWLLFDRPLEADLTITVSFRTANPS